MTRRRPSNRSRILGSGFRPHIGNRCRFPKHLAHRLRAGRWSSGFLPADTLDASRSDADMKSWDEDGNNRVVCHEPEGTADQPGRARPSATRPRLQPAERLRRLQLPDRPLHTNRLRRCNPESVGAQPAASFLFFFPNRRGVPSFRIQVSSPMRPVRVKGADSYSSRWGLWDEERDCGARVRVPPCGLSTRASTRASTRVLQT
jgi:hypothetical protein